MIAPLQYFDLKRGYFTALLIFFSTSFFYGIDGNTADPRTFLNFSNDNPDTCPDCFSSDVIEETTLENGCIRYTVKISNDGDCRHALSHYTVEIPCGSVSDITNSEGWKVEIRKDPTTGLEGFKIDDINDFGESGAPGSFTVDFTVCRDDCEIPTDCQEVRVAHKAGLCITSENLELCSVSSTTSDNNDYGNTDCLAQAAEGGGHAVWINDYIKKDKDGQFFFDQNGGSVELFEDGTGHITGTVYLSDHPEDQWELDFWMTDRKNWEEWSATGGGFKGDPNIVGDQYKTWSYSILDNNKSRLIGKGGNKGKTLHIKHYPAKYEYALQMGDAANDKNGNKGLSIWFTYEYKGKLYRGDLNFDLICKEEETPGEENPGEENPGEENPGEETPEDCIANELAANMITGNVSCAGAQDGSVSIEIIGGSAPFTFAWSNGASTQGINALGGGNYSVDITDTNGATLQLSGTVFEPSLLSVSGTTSPLSCGATNGAISLNISGGTAPYSYSWSNGGTEKDQTGLTAGTYQVTVTDANGCWVTEDFVLLATSDISATISTNGCNDGSLVLDIVGGVPPYTYSWSTGETTKDITVDGIGTYDVTVADVNGCSASTSIDVTALTAISLSVTPTTPTCGGASNGAIDLSVNGGQAPYTYSWSLGSTEIATTQDLNNVASGNYTVVVTDSRQCSQELTYFLRNPVSIFISEDVELIRCDGNGADGAIDISIFNAGTSYSTSWTTDSNPGVVYSTAEDLQNLGPDVYTITVTNNSTGCQASKSIELAAPEDFQVDLSQQYCGDGYICPTVSGGNGSFSYQWSGPVNSFTVEQGGCISANQAGTYTVEVTDEAGCVRSASIAIGAPNPSLSATVSSTNPTCGSNNGSATVSITGGDGNYAILWSTGAVNVQSISGLSAGTYTVKVTDGNECQKFLAFNLQGSQSPVISASTVTEASCNGESDGVIDITVSNGTAPYSYQWSTGATTEDLSGVGAGEHSVTVTDTNGCSVNMSFNLMVDPDNTGCDNGNGDGGNDGGDGGDNGDGDGDGDGTTDPCIRDCNTCDGKVVALTLKYLGDEPNAQIIVKQQNGGQIVFDGAVSADGEFSFNGTDANGTLTSGIVITVNGAGETIISTDCSQPIGPGLVAGTFEVVAGESRNGGMLCPVDAEDTQEEVQEQEEQSQPQGQDCDECHESQLISMTESEGGCVTYTIEVSNNGACAHALSHYSVRIPCGIVTEASNSGGWKMELNGKDPSTNLYGLKVDDIHGFGEDGQAGSFTVTYTVCSNQDENCSGKLKEEDIIVGYKAALCAKIEKVASNAQVANFEQPTENMPLTFVRFSVYPNPVEANSTEGLKLEFQEANIGEKLNVKVVSVAGQIIYTKSVEISRANEVLPLRTAGMAPGFYYVTVTSQHKVYSEKIIVK